MTRAITVIVCTYNRSRSLARTLDSVVAQTLSQSIAWEILVVDNNSDDETREVVEDFRNRYPDRIRYLLEPKQGVSNARNAGVQHARGEIVAFIDDDESADVGWLQNLTANLHSDEWAGAGGRVLPQWSSPPPRWLLRDSPFLSAPLAMFDVGQEAGRLTEPPYGANMAFRKEMFARYGGFRTDLGRIGKGMLSGEDTEFGARVMAAGLRLRYEPSAVTNHPVEGYRVNRKYFLRWWFNKGRSDVRGLPTQPGGIRFLGIPLKLIRHAATDAVRWLASVDPAQRFICKLKIWTYAGQVFESYHRSLEAKQKGPERNVEIRPPAEGGR
jgi:glucosyl-dolichyl phosphate glucuronosyltransferase